MLKSLVKTFRKSSLPVTLAISAVLTYYVVTSENDLRNSLTFHAGGSALLAVMVTTRFLLTAIINQVALAELGAKTSSRESFALASIASTFNMFMPLNSGLLFRAIYLKRRYNLAYSHFASTQIGVQMLWILAACAVSLVALLLVGDLRSPAILTGIAACAACSCTALAALYFPLIKKRGNRLWDKLALVSEGCHTLRLNRPLMLKMLVLAIAKALCDGLIFWSGCLSVGLPANLLGAVALTGFASLAMCLSITPGALGTYEALIGLISQAALLTPVEGVTVSLIVRGMGYAIAIILFPVCCRWLMTHHGWHWSERETSDDPQQTATPRPLSKAA